MAKNALQKYETTETGLQLPENLDWKEWRVLFEGYSHMAKCVPWAIGDLLVYGESHYGEDVSQAMSDFMAKTRYTQGTIYNLVYISRNVPPWNRNPNLSHSFHYEVAKMDSQEQVHWLARAELEGWTVKEFRDHISGRAGNTEPKEQEEPKPIEEEKPKKQKCTGTINDQFDLWWDWYASGKGYGEKERLIALDAYNASVEEGDIV